MNMTEQEKIDKLRAALGALLADVDFTAGACTANEMVGAVINPITLKVCHEAMEAVRP
jgi:hypothetical protein